MRREIRAASLMLGALVSCSPERAQRPNVILVSIDTLRADHVGAYGYERDTTPFLDELARQSLLFEHAFTPASWTLTAHASMLTGLRAEEHGLVEDGLAFAPGSPLLAERLAAAGYDTIGLYFEGWIDSERGFGRGFGHFQAHENAEEAGQNLAVALARHDPSRPLFLFLHLFDVHSLPFTPGRKDIYAAPEPFGSHFLDESCAPLPDLAASKIWESGLRDDAQLETLVARYDGAIRYVDAKLREWVAELERRGLWTDALMIVTADHGEALGQRGGRLKGHGGSNQEGLRVPLIVRLPRGQRAGERSTVPVQLMDIAPTVLDVCGLSPDARLGGFSLRGTIPTQRVIDGSRQGSRFALEWPRKFVEGSGRVSCFDLEADPGELAPRAGESAELDRLVGLARGARGPYPAPVPMGTSSPDREERLRDLGYGGELDDER